MLLHPHEDKHRQPSGTGEPEPDADSIRRLPASSHGLPGGAACSDSDETAGRQTTIGPSTPISTKATAIDELIEPYKVFTDRENSSYSEMRQKARESFNRQIEDLGGTPILPTQYSSRVSAPYWSSTVQRFYKNDRDYDIFIIFIGVSHTSPRGTQVPIFE